METLRRKFVDLHGHEVHAVRRGRHVAEIIGANRIVVRAARAFLRWEEPEVVTWTVDMQVAGIESAEDWMRWNPLFNVLGKHREVPAGDGGAAAAELKAAAEGFVFRDTVEPLEVTTGGLCVWRIRLDGGRPTVAGVPRITLRATVPVSPFTVRSHERVPPRREWTEVTTAWPADAERIRAIVKSVLPDPDAVPPRERVERLLGWVHRNIRYSGMRVGSRYGTLKVIEQGYGHCWDQSDVLITLCRAAGVPARQVGGWLVGVSGHVWLEVLLPDEGWLPVDATASWLGVSEHYVPLWASDDGPIPLVYWGAPSIERVEPGSEDTGD